ncbi:MAG TPA: biotin/lipoyl-containing protein, partial [Burkholderiaceae bacterium]
MIDLRMPSFGADMDDAVFVQWNVQPGQAVGKGDIACTVETQKGAIDVDVWQAGTVARLLAEPGQRIPVGQLLARLATQGEDWQAVAAAPLPEVAEAVGAPPAAASPGAAPAATPAA